MLEIRNLHVAVGGKPILKGLDLTIPAGEHIGERRLAGAVRPHDGGDLALVHGEVQPADDLCAVFGDAGVEVSDLKHLLSVFKNRCARSGVSRGGG